MSPAPRINIEVHSHGEGSQAAPYIDIKIYGYVENSQAAPRISVNYHNSPKEDVKLRTDGEHDEDIQEVKTTSQAAEEEKATIQTLVEHDENFKLNLAYLWEQLPYTIRLQIMEPLHIDTALRSSLSRKGPKPIVTDVAWPSTGLISGANHSSSRLEDIVDVLMRWQKLFLEGNQELSIRINDTVDPDWIQRLADLAGPQAKRIVFNVEPWDQDIQACLERLPHTVASTVLLDSNALSKKSSEFLWPQLPNRLVLPSHVDYAFIRGFDMDNSTFSVNCGALVGLMISGSKFTGSGCDLTGIQQLGTLLITKCDILSWEFSTMLPKAIEHIRFNSVTGGPVSAVPQLPDSLQRISFLDCSVMFARLEVPWNFPANVQTIHLQDTSCDFELLQLRSSEGLLSFSMCFTDECESYLQIADKHICFLFPHSIKKIHIDTGGKDQYEEYDVQRVKWFESLKLRHPQADIKIT